MRFIKYVNETNGITFSACLGKNADPAAEAEKKGWPSFELISRAEYESLFTPTLEEARAAKLGEIVSGANEVKALLSSRFSALEEGTWPEQEAGARSLLNDLPNVKDITARLILADELAMVSAVALVESLAQADGVSPLDFAARIVANADQAHQLAMLTLAEQRSFEAALRAAASVEDIHAIKVTYTVTGQAHAR